MAMSQEQWRSADFFHMTSELPIVVNGGFINLEAILVRGISLQSRMF